MLVHFGRGLAAGTAVEGLDDMLDQRVAPVSYTHLTLPTT